ncbi:BRCA1-associated protein-like [Limulus polyphemus]|uniref:BRCA1-associated protein-like n=1 Tax=Limulus polyphemus TaxID=6850 RepID=A0ABM1BDZ1_LIMPO|nr:BRCA1-associated protein-like [Limulus polyphemus]
MSISLVILRFEIASDYPLIPDLHYTDKFDPLVTKYEDTERQSKDLEHSELVHSLQKPELTDISLPFQVTDEKSIKPESVFQKPETTDRKEKKIGEPVETFMKKRESKKNKKSRGGTRDKPEKQAQEIDAKRKEKSEYCTTKSSDGNDKTKETPESPKEKNMVSYSEIVTSSIKQSEKEARKLDIPENKDLDNKFSLGENDEPVSENSTTSVTRITVVTDNLNAEETFSCINESQKELSPVSSEGGQNVTDKCSKNMCSQIQFYSGNHFVEVTKGILHLYKENQAGPSEEDDLNKAPSGVEPIDQQPIKALVTPRQSSRDETLARDSRSSSVNTMGEEHCEKADLQRRNEPLQLSSFISSMPIASLPLKYRRLHSFEKTPEEITVSSNLHEDSPVDLSLTTGNGNTADFSDIEHIRIIRDAKPNLYMVLLKFRTQKMADEFYKSYNGVRFNTIEPELCHLVYVAKVETVKESEEICMPLSGLTELPTCPVCLERMDESVEGILTILCNHSFHGTCLSKWGDTSCPVCRYCQTPEPVPDNHCFGCGSQESLWICLICGHVGCGRYVDGHAFKHYVETEHTYAMQLGNNRVWDYTGDNYVHRLVQSKGDGKPVELESNRLSLEQEEKLDSVQLEYTYLLTSQLEAQRHFFEDRIARVEKEMFRQLEELKEKTKQAVEERKELEEKLARVSKEKQTHERKVSQLTGKLNKLSSELKEEKEMNKCLRQYQQQWQDKLKDTEHHLMELKENKEKEITDLKDQVRDLMFYLEAQEKLQHVSETTRQEIEEGQIVVGATGQSHSSNSRHRRRRLR